MTGVPDWARVKKVVEAALDRPPGEREQIVARICDDDGALLAEVQSLLGAIERAGTFIERPAIQSFAASTAAEIGEGRDRSRHALQPGAAFGPYSVLELLGAGGGSFIVT